MKSAGDWAATAWWGSDGFHICLRAPIGTLHYVRVQEVGVGENQSWLFPLGRVDFQQFVKFARAEKAADEHLG